MSQITENVRKIENRAKIEQAWIGALQCSELVRILREGFKKKKKKIVKASTKGEGKGGMSPIGNFSLKNTAKRTRQQAGNMSRAVCASSMNKSLDPPPI